MANLNTVLSQLEQRMSRIEAKLDALLKAQGVEVPETVMRLESPKPIKTFVSEQVKPAPAPVAQPEPPAQGEEDSEPAKSRGRRKSA